MPSPQVRSGPGPAETGPGVDAARGANGSSAAVSARSAFSKTLQTTAQKREHGSQSAVDAPSPVQPVRQHEAGTQAAAADRDAAPDQPQAEADLGAAPDHEPDSGTPVADDRSSTDEHQTSGDAQPPTTPQPTVAQERPIVVVTDGEVPPQAPEALKTQNTPAQGPASDQAAAHADAQDAESPAPAVRPPTGQTGESPANARGEAVQPVPADQRPVADQAPPVPVTDIKPSPVDRRSDAKTPAATHADADAARARSGDSAASSGGVPSETGEAGEQSEGDAPQDDGANFRRPGAAAAGHDREHRASTPAPVADRAGPDEHVAQWGELRPKEPARSQGTHAEPPPSGSGSGTAAPAEAGVFKLAAEPVVARTGGEPMARPDAAAPPRPAGSAHHSATAGNAGAQDADGLATTATVRGLAAALMQKGGSVTIRLMPEMLGDLKIQMTIDRGSVSVDLTARNAEAHDLLSRSMGTLRSALEARGLGVERMSVHLSTQAPAQPATNSGDQPPTRDEQRAGGQHDAGGGASRGRDDGRGASGDRSGGAGTDSESDDRGGRGAYGPDARGFATRLRLTLDAVA